jgi:hypothetical protein
MPAKKKEKSELRSVIIVLRSPGKNTAMLAPAGFVNYFFPCSPPQSFQCTKPQAKSSLPER